MGRTALLCGASGLVGGYCLTRLLAAGSYDRVVVATRRDLGALVQDARVDQAIVEFAALDPHADRLRADDVFCALGTTIRKAGSQERFREVDFQYPLNVAHIARAGGAAHFSLVSSLGARAGARGFYLRVKGELEDAVRGVGLPSLTILRPSVIAGPRRESRPAERVGRWLLAVAPRAWRPVHADTIAAAMVARATVSPPGAEAIESKDIGSAAGLGADWRVGG